VTKTAKGAKAAKVAIGGVEIPVEEVSPHVLGEGVLGTYEGCPRQRIAIRKGLDPALRAQTLLHETLHAIDEMYGLGLGENRIRVLEQVLTGLWKHNPALRTG
jgi:hypothetical protein